MHCLNNPENPCFLRLSLIEQNSAIIPIVPKLMKAYSGRRWYKGYSGKIQRTLDGLKKHRMEQALGQANAHGFNKKLVLYCLLDGRVPVL